MSAAILRKLGTYLFTLLLLMPLSTFGYGLVTGGYDDAAFQLENYFEWCWPMFLCLAITGLMFRFEGAREGCLSRRDSRIILFTASMNFLAMFTINIGLIATSSKPVARVVQHFFS